MASKAIVALFINASSLFLVALFAGCGGGAAQPAGPTFGMEKTRGRGCGRNRALHLRGLT